jgi:hypothetical protein
MTFGASLKAIRIATATILVICAVLCILFGAELILITSEISSFSGSTDIVGKVVDSGSEPLSNVSVRNRGISVFTDDLGIFDLKGVPQGKVEIELYLEGYVGLRIGLIAYPDEKRWIGDEGAPNDLRDDPFVLYDEIEWENAIEADGSTLEHIWNPSSLNSSITVNLDNRPLVEPVTLRLLQGDSIRYQVTQSTESIGNRFTADLPSGIYNLTLTGRDVLDRGFTDLNLTPGSTILNITAEAQSFFSYGIDQRLSGNYLLGALYLMIGALSAIGAYLAVKSDRWTWLMIICVISFFGRGPMDVIDINVMPIFSMIATVLVIIMRNDMVRGRRSFRPRPSGTT